MNGSFDQLLESGFAAHCAGDLPRAMSAYSSALVQAPDHVSALSLQMAAAQDANDWASAYQYFERTAHALAKNPLGLVPLARLFLSQQRFDLAMATVLFLRNLARWMDLSSLTAEIKAGQDRLCNGSALEPSRDILLICPIYISSSEHVRQVELWQSAVDRFNPGIDWLMVDDGSSWDRLESLPLKPGVALTRLSSDTPHAVPLTASRTIASFPSNVGHSLSGRGNDGPGRSIAAGIKCAIHNCYRHAVVLEIDVYTRLNLRGLAAQMKESKMTAMTTRVRPWNFIESGLMLLDVQHLAMTGYADRYAWDKITFLPQVEWVYEATLGQVSSMPWTGGRNDFNQFTGEAIRRLDYLTHCSDPNLYVQYINGNGDPDSRGSLVEWGLGQARSAVDRSVNDVQSPSRMADEPVDHK
jgi:hypothetical protein